MHLLDQTLTTAAENLALDEALLEHAEHLGRPAEVLRFWEPTQPMIVLGSSSPSATEVNLDVCRARNIPVLRRPSGGATIVTGPGCLMYAVVLSYELHPDLRSIDRAHRFVLDTIAASLQPKLPEFDLHRAGTSDLAISDRKFSGNSMRCKRTHLLYHGTLLYNIPLDQVEQLLHMPSRQPEYRENRSHRDFLTNLPLSAATLRSSLIEAFHADAELPSYPTERIAQLIAERYGRDEWNFRL